MTEEKHEKAPESPEVEEQGSESQSEEAQASSEQAEQLLEELGKLGEKLIDVAQAAWNSDQRKQLGADLSSGLTSLAKTLDEGLENIGQNEKVRKTVDKAEQTASEVGGKLRESTIAQDLANGLISGVQTLAEQLDKMTAEMKSDDEQAKSDSDDGQEIPIEKG